MVLLAGTLWGVISIFINGLSAAGLDSLQISFVRLFVAAAGFVGFLAVSDRKRLRIAFKDVWMFIGTGIVSVALFNTCYFHTMINAGASVAVVLLYTSPVWIMLMSALLFRERITARKCIALAATIGGCVLVTGVITGKLSVAPTALLTGIASGIFYGLYTIFGKLALKKYDSLTVTAYTFLFGFIGSIPLGKPVGTVRIVCGNLKVLILCIGIGIVSTILPYVFYTMGLRELDSGKAAIIVAVEPLVGAVIGMTVYKEPHNPAKLAGIVLILAAIVILNMPEKAAKPAKNMNGDEGNMPQP